MREMDRGGGGRGMVGGEEKGDKEGRVFLFLFSINIIILI